MKQAVASKSGDMLQTFRDFSGDESTAPAVLYRVRDYQVLDNYAPLQLDDGLFSTSDDICIPLVGQPPVDAFQRFLWEMTDYLYWLEQTITEEEIQRVVLPVLLIAEMDWQSLNEPVSL